MTTPWKATASIRLLGRRRFLPLFATQFLGALNDNVLKAAAVILLTFQSTAWTSIDSGLLANLAGGIFILPFFLFSALAGQLADRHDKALIARRVKALEIAIVLMAGVGFALHSIAVLFGAIGLLGLHSTFFGPVKYAILPQHLLPGELTAGNALVEAGTFVAILLGTLLGGLLAASDQAGLLISASGLVIALIGYATSRYIPAAPALASMRATPLGPVGETWRSLRHLLAQRTIRLATLGISWFWLYGAVLLAQIPAFARQTLGGAESTVTLMLTLFTLGVSTGSMLCASLARGPRAWVWPLAGALGLSLFAFDLVAAFPTATTVGPALELGRVLAVPGSIRVMADLVMIGLCGGLFIVPLYTLLQVHADEGHRSRTIATNNILNALFMVIGSVLAGAALTRGADLPRLFDSLAIGNMLGAVWIAWCLRRARQPDQAPGANPP